MSSLISLLTLLQTQTSPETVDMADTMRSNGKIYVVVAVLSLIFLGIILFLIAMDRKVSRLEKRIENTPER